MAGMPEKTRLTQWIRFTGVLLAVAALAGCQGDWAGPRSLPQDPNAKPLAELAPPSQRANPHPIATPAAAPVARASFDDSAASAPYAPAPPSDTLRIPSSVGLPQAPNIAYPVTPAGPFMPSQQGASSPVAPSSFDAAFGPQRRATASISDDTQTVADSAAPLPLGAQQLAQRGIQRLPGEDPTAPLETPPAIDLGARGEIGPAADLPDLSPLHGGLAPEVDLPSKELAEPSERRLRASQLFDENPQLEDPQFEYQLPYGDPTPSGPSDSAEGDAENPGVVEPAGSPADSDGETLSEADNGPPSDAGDTVPATENSPAEATETSPDSPNELPLDSSAAAPASAAASLLATIEALRSETAGDADPSDRRLLQLLEVIADPETRWPVASQVAAEGQGESDQAWQHVATAAALQLRGRDLEQTLPAAESAVQALRDQAPLKLENVAFCRQIDDYGIYAEFKSHFSPGQELLLYVEVDHFTHTPSPDGVTIELHGGYEIVDSEGNVVEAREFLADKQTFRRPRRDYYVPYRLFVPKDIEGGEYVMRLKLKDAASGKTGEASVPLPIRVPQP